MLRLTTRASTDSAFVGLAALPIAGPAMAIAGDAAMAGGSGLVTSMPLAEPSRPILGQPRALSTRVAESSLEDRVAEVQRMLKRQGFNAGPVDGKLGLRTRDAIRAYQSLVRAKEGAVSPDAAETLSREKGPPTPRAKPAIDQ
jgi:hypothetical protein